jgi:hypothetical protein
MLASLSVGRVRRVVVAGSTVVVLAMATCMVFAQQEAPPSVQPDPGVGQQTAPPQASAAASESLRKRRDHRDEQALRDELLRVPEINILDGQSGTAESLKHELGVRTATKKAASSRSTTTAGASSASPAERLPLSLSFQHRRWEALGLEPFPDTEGLLEPNMSQSLERTATQLRRWGLVSSLGRKGELIPPRRTQRISPSVLGKEWNTGQQLGTVASPVPAIVQLLQAEEQPSRSSMIELLAAIEGLSASRALAQRAVYDLSPSVREAALHALRDRPRAEYRHVLLEALRYPWAPVADHAAEALVVLQDREAVPLLRTLLDLPDPGMPTRTQDAYPPVVVRELVRVNHFRNCLLCHAPSFDAKDRLLAPVPTPGKEIPVQYYASRRSTGDLLVRADVTYLRQDFSVVQPVADAAPWPDRQRYDFLVRLRPATAEELARLDKPPATYPQREAVQFALRELSD